MRQSALLLKTLQDEPKDETSVNAKLLMRAGYIYKEMAGVYSMLPLGLRVIDKISNIIRSEMKEIGGVEMKSAVLQNPSVWQKSERWSDSVVDNWFKSKLKSGAEIGLAFTHEEPIAAMLTNYVSSHKDLPIYLFDITNVFRNEKRAKSGLLRSREFIWKALYSFCRDENEHYQYYERVKKAYQKIFALVGLGKKTYITFASGGSFSKYSHEFQTICPAGEDIVFVDEKRKIAINSEVYSSQVIKDLGMDKNRLVEKKAIEVGNIFTLGFKFSDPLNLKYRDADGKEKFVFMGSYGIGISRLMGAIVETNYDEKGIVWPISVAPYQIHLLEIKSSVKKVKKETERLYKILVQSGCEVLYDDREVSAGEKLVDSDLIGIPWRVIISERSLKSGGAEIKARNCKEVFVLPIDKILSYFRANVKNNVA